MLPQNDLALRVVACLTSDNQLEDALLNAYEVQKKALQLGDGDALEVSKDAIYQIQRRIQAAGKTPEIVGSITPVGSDVIVYTG